MVLIFFSCLSPSSWVWNLSRNARVCLGFRPPRGQALVHGEEGSLRIREEKALEFNNFFFQIYQRKWEIYFLGLPRSARAYNPWEGVLWSMVRREGRLGLWAPKNFSKSQLLVCGTCLGIPGSAWGSDCLGGRPWSMVGGGLKYLSRT